jgi:[ribosomal protein S18]-alanine N-acetyltransferase
VGCVDSKPDPMAEGAVASTSALEATNADLTIREIRVADLEDVLAIERASFASPWSRQFFLEELQASCAKSVLSDVGGAVVGYCLYWELSNDLDIHNVAVHPEYRRQGVARGMLRHIVGEAQRIGSQSITLEVRKSNEGAQALYRSLGFEICGVRKGYYSNDGEDAWVMILRLKSTSSVR